MQTLTFHEDGTFEAFAQLLKFDESTGEGEGILAIEEPDQSNEIMDYEASKSVVLNWSDTFSKVTGGKSAGNLRVMHSPVVAGRFTEVNADDATKSFPVKFVITDPIQKRHAANGDYTGLSVGGRYGRKWKDEGNAALTRYAIDKVAEGSLVDNPCMPNARFVLKTEAGSELQKRFKAATKQYWSCGDEGCAKKHEKREDALACEADADDLAKIAARDDVSDADKKRAASEASDFADTKNKKYKLDTPEEVKAAWSYIHMPKNASKYSAEDVKSIKAKIVSAWKKKIDPAGPPSAKKEDDADDLTKQGYSAPPAGDAGLQGHDLEGQKKKAAKADTAEEDEMDECQCCADEADCGCASQVVGGCSCHADCSVCEEKDCAGSKAEKVADVIELTKDVDPVAVSAVAADADLTKADEQSKDIADAAKEQAKAEKDKAKDDKKAAKEKYKAAKEKSKADEKAADDKLDAAPDAAKAADVAGANLLAKCLDCVARLATIIGSAESLSSWLDSHEAGGDDDDAEAQASDKIDAATSQLYAVLIDIVKDCEEDAAARRDKTDEQRATMAMSALADSLRKTDGADQLITKLTKGDDMNKRSDADLAKVTGDLTKALGDIAKVAASIDEVKASVADLAAKSAAGESAFNDLVEITKDNVIKTVLIMQRMPGVPKGVVGATATVAIAKSLDSADADHETPPADKAQTALDLMKGVIQRGPTVRLLT